MKIEASTRIKIVAGDGEDWFSSLSKEQQDQYIELHPNSKYADAAKSKPDSLPKKDNPKKGLVKKITDDAKKTIKKRKDKAVKKLKKRYPITTKLVEFLTKGFKSKELTNIPSKGWKAKHGAEAVKKVSKYGYFKSKDVWVSETKQEWDSAVASNPNGETYEGVKDKKNIRSV